MPDIIDDSTLAAPTGQFYTVALPAVDDSAVADIVSAVVTDADAGQTMVYAASFDGGTTIKAWDGDSWETVTTAASTGWMTEATIEGIADADWPSLTGDLILYAGFQTASAASNPSLTAATWNVEGQRANMTAAPASAQTIAADAQQVHAYVRVAPVDAITAGTDITMRVSIDGGTTWATGSWVQVAGSDLWRVEHDVHLQAGTSLTYEVATANHKDLYLEQICGLVCLY
jgi:hypothetical protein